MQDLDLIYPQDPCVHIRVGRVIMGESHHVRAALHVDLISPSPEVVCCVVHCHREPLFEALANYEDLVKFVIYECGVFWVVLTMQNASEEVMLQARNKILVNR